ncbi:carbohydrate sulfotransferase 10-like [Panulirus ornatus]|uniref:carbohydrate sulfotransferase 10-like n=1 Tax=Panulirus ornatus TaxID=150431 RepID=UPI003A888FD2
MVRKLYPPPESAGEKDRMLQNFMRLIIVRHPFERLLSAYRDKMLRVRNKKDPFVKLQRQISQQYMNSEKTLSCNATVDTSSTGQNKTPVHPSFTQFLEKVQDDVKRLWEKGHSSINLHWRPYWTTCAPCQIDYDVIAHVETLDWDQEYIIRELGLQELLLNAHTHASNFDRYKGTSEAAQFYFSQVPASLLRSLAQLYKPDFKLFGYSPENYLKMTKREFVNDTLSEM